MSRTPTQHLTDADFANLLAGEQASAPAAQHLAVCAHCSAELEQVRLSLSSFGDIASHWSQLEAPARVPVPSRWALGLTGWPTLATGAAVTVLTGMLVFTFGPASRSPIGAASAPAISATTTVPTKTELANDNRLMLSIDEELTTRAKPGVSASDFRSATLSQDASSSPEGAATIVD